MKKEKYIVEKTGKNGTTLEVKIPYRDKFGDRKFHSKSFNTSKYPSNSDAMRAATKYRNEILCQIEMNESLDMSAKKTVKDCYELSKQFLSLSLETQRKHDIRFNYLDKYHSIPITKITAFDIQMSLNQLVNKSQDVIRSVFTIWKQIYQVAIANDYTYKDMTLKVQLPKSNQISVPKSVDMNCSLEEVVDAIRDYGKNSFDSNIIAYSIITIAYLGLRPSEAYALTKNDIDFKRKTVLINKSVGSTTNDFVNIKPTKNLNSVRLLPLPDELIPVLHECINIQPSHFLFATESGQLLNSRKHSNFIHDATKKAGLNFRPYMLRHAFSTKLVTSNTDLRTIQELMGHKNANMTLSYARSSDELKREAINKISR